jgi:nicotinamide phosphoribosyltransferase
VLVTIENTDPACYWLPNYLETLLVQVWYPCTVATQSREMKKVIVRYLNETGDPGGADFKLHDFGFRGVSSVETAGLGGAAHLVNFRGTDTLAGIVLARDFYACPMAGFSIPASEHSTITSWGKEHELDAMKNMLDQYPTGLVACVSDSFDVFRACREFWGGELRDKILHRDGTLVVRPDSGDPVTVILQVLAILGDRFGTTTNPKGYRVLDPHVRIIQGDGVDYEMIGTILGRMRDAGWSADNLAFGSGGGLLQKLNRDTLKFAFKCSSATVNGEERDVFKQPITDAGKKSKSGRLALVRGVNGFETVRADSPRGDDELREVFRDGRVTRAWTFNEVRAHAAT